MLELLASLVAIPSLSRQEGDAADTVAAFATGAGFDVRRKGNNVIFELGQGPPRLLLNSHIDTVPPCDGWDSDPYIPVVEDHRLTGLGANDAKGCVTAILLAAGKLGESWITRGTLVIAITAEEEIGGAGGITSILPELGQLDAAVFGEPTGMAPCLGQRGMLLLDCLAQGESGHVAHASQLRLRNAIHQAAADVTALSDLSFEPYIDWTGKTHLTGAQTTVIRGGISANQVPDACEFRVDLRTTPNLDQEQVLAAIKRTIGSPIAKVSARYRPRTVDPHSPIASAALHATGKPAFFSDTVSDWSLVEDIPAVKIGPGDSRRSHRPNEFLLASELAEGVEVYVRLIEEFFREWPHG